MSDIKRNGVLVRPGKYKLRGKDEIRTIAELKKAIRKHTDGIMLTYGHATDGSPIPGADQFVGKAYPYWDSTEKAVLANYSFFDEFWDTIPEDVRNKIVNKETVPISIGYRVDGINEDSTQDGIVFTHVALVPEGKEPIAKDVGVNVRMETERELERELNLPPNYRLESGEIPEVEEPTEEPKAAPEYVTKADFDAFMGKFDAFIESQKTPEPESEPAVESEPEPVESTQEELKPVAEVQMPAGEDKGDEPKFVRGIMTTHSS